MDNKKEKKVKELVKNVVKETLMSEDVMAGGSKKSYKFTYKGDTYGAFLSPDDRENRLLLHILLPDRRPVDPGGLRDDAFDLMDHLERGNRIRLVPIPGYYTEDRLVYKVKLDSVLETLIK